MPSLPESDAASTESSWARYSPTPLSPSARPHFPRSFSHTATIAGLERIFDSNIGICIWRRPIDETIERYLAQLCPDSSWLGLRFTITQRPLCPRFHADGVSLRLICTWQGPGTQWLEHASVNRACLGGGGKSSDETSGLMLPGAQIYRMSPFEVGLFKGDAHPGNEGRGAVHRSPPADGAAVWRVMASLDDIDQS